MWRFFILLATLSVMVDAQYGTLPQPTTAVVVSTESSTDSLQGVFNAAKGFVDVVFVPFAKMQEHLIVFLTSDNLVQTLNDKWQEILKVQAGLITCMVFGALFIVLVIFGGLLMCIIRCCCGRCGGKMKQSSGRSKSKWRTVFFISLLVCGVLILIPGVFVLQTNEWINTIVDDTPDQGEIIIQNGINYVDSIEEQLNYILAQYRRLSSTLLNKFLGLNNSLGSDVSNRITSILNPVLDRVSAFGDELTTLNNALAQYESLRAEAISDYNVYLYNLTEYKSNYEASLVACNDSNCDEVRQVIGNLSAGTTFNSFPDWSLNSTALSTHMLACSDVYQNATTSVSEGIVTSVDDSIPNNLISDATQDFNNSLISADTDISSMVNDLNLFDQMRSYLVDFKNSIKSAFQSYDSFDKYRWIAGVVLGTFIIVMVACYVVGALLGHFFTLPSTSPTERGRLSSFAGILLMSGAGLTFLFSWLLMLLVTVTFMAGGTVERYVCQTATKPYELLEFVDTQAPLDFSSGGQTVNSDLTNLMISCESNAALLTVFGLEDIANVSNIRSELAGSLNDVNLTFSITLNSDSKIFSTGLETCFDAARDSETLGVYESLPSWSGQDFTEPISELNQLKNNIPSGFQTIVEDAANDLAAIQNQVYVMNELVQAMNARRASFPDNLETTLTNLKSDTQQADTDVENALGTSVSDVISASLADYIAEIDIFLSWFTTQMTTNLGACLPVYQMYTDIILVSCDYLVDTLNGFWFSLGWAVFFMIPAAILAIKLTKFYRKMDETDALPPEPVPQGVELLGLKEVSMKMNGASNQQPKTTPFSKPSNKIAPYMQY